MDNPGVALGMFLLPKKRSRGNVFPVRNGDSQLVIRERVLITVRTYPVLSQKHVETVCTGGITDTGEWRRLYPVSLRYLDREKQYKTFDIVEVEVKPGKDDRPESRVPVVAGMRVVTTLKGWAERRGWIERTAFTSLEEMVAAGKSLAPVRVREVLEFVAKPGPTEWTAAQTELLKQGDLFFERKPLEKIPFDFRFRWIDGAGKQYNSHVIAWEFGETWRTYKKRYADPIAVMRDKWMNDLCATTKRDLLFFMGNDNRFRDQFYLCGIFGPPKQEESEESHATLW